MARRLAFFVAGVMAVAACADSTAPAPISAPHHLRWAPMAGPRAAKIAREGPQAGPNGSMNAASDTEVYSFWAVRGQTRTLDIEFPASGIAGDTVEPFLKLTVPPGALASRPDGTPFADGDSVLITATVDEDLLLVEFQPSGLTFSSSDPALLSIWYTGAQGDLDSDGDVDQDDVYIDAALLGVWYQGDGSTNWDEIEATQSFVGKWFDTPLLHFSTYAISW